MICQPPLRLNTVSVPILSNLTLKPLNHDFDWEKKSDTIYVYKMTDDALFQMDNYDPLIIPLPFISWFW